MFTKWLRKYFEKDIANYGAMGVNYLSNGLPRNWAIRNGEFVNLDVV